jgi:hypothetical protein
MQPHPDLSQEEVEFWRSTLSHECRAGLEEFFKKGFPYWTIRSDIVDNIDITGVPVVDACVAGFWAGLGMIPGSSEIYVHAVASRNEVSIENTCICENVEHAVRALDAFRVAAQKIHVDMRTELVVNRAFNKIERG